MRAYEKWLHIFAFKPDLCFIGLTDMRANVIEQSDLPTQCWWVSARKTQLHC